MTTHICDLSPSDEPAESARALLYRHGLPEDVVDGALALHAQELAALQRLRMDELDLVGQKARIVGRIVDLIDPTLTTSAAASVPPPADRAGLRDRIAAAIWERQNPGRRWADCEYRWRADAEEDADAVLGVLPPTADRAAALTGHERAMLSFALEMAQEEIHARSLEFTDEDRAALERLRRVADETRQQPTDQTAAPAAWVDGHPQLEAIAAAVWESCAHDDCGSVVVDDPRNIAVAALTALRVAAAAPQPETQAAEDPARIDRLRPEFGEHASVEAIDAQLQRARAQQRRWHLRAEWLVSLRADRVAQQERGEWPAAEAQQ